MVVYTMMERAVNINKIRKVKMKLNKLIINNFMRIGLINIDLPEVVTLFAGKNQSGKSSLAEAIKFALTSDLVRVDKKGDFKLVVKDGSKSGFASVTIDGVEIKRDIKSAKEADNGDLSVQLPEYLPYLLDAQSFASQKMDKRRNFLIGLTGTKIDGKNISERMRIKEVTENCIEMILPMLRSGFTAAHKEAQSRASESRQQWTGLTSCQRYGSVIAATWKPTLPEDFNHKAYLEKEKKLEQLKTSIDQLNIKKGGLIAKINDAKKELCQGQEPVKFKQADLTKVNKQIEQAEISLRTQETTHTDLNNKFFNAKEKSPVECCECGSLLKVEFTNDSAKGRIAIVEPYQPMSDDDMKKLQADIFTVGGNISKLKNDLQELRGTASQLEANKTEVKNKKSSTITRDDVDKLDKELEGVNLLLDDRGEDYNTLNEAVTNMRIISEKITDAEKITNRAKDLHESVQDWEKCVEALAPDGIPAEILSDTLKPVNDRLRNTANVTGWPQVTIDPTMEIIVDGRRYSLLSESAQWRADAAITDAIANLSGLSLMIIDRMDVLDLEGRKEFMTWINSIMAGYDSILIFSTLKKLPVLPEGMKAHWIKNGEISLK